MAVFTHIKTDSGTNADISSATAIGTYTATADKLVMVDVSIDQVAGDGDYVMYVTRQIGGSGSSYVILPKTTMAAASGETAISAQSGWITVRNGDVLTCYVDGLAGDTSTPDWTTRWFEDSGTVTGVTLGATQGAITWGQQKIIADADDEGALHIENINADGYGQLNVGGSSGVLNIGGDAAVENIGETFGMYSSGDTAGMYNAGSTAGMHNYSSSTGGAGMKNEAQGSSSSGMRNEAQGSSSVGIRNIGTTGNVAGYDPDQATEATLTAIKAKTDNLPADPAAVGSAMTLTAAYDKAKDDVLTPLATVDGVVDAIKVQTDKIPASPASAGEYTTNIGAIKAKTDNLPLSPASSGEYTSALTAIQNDLDNPNQYKADVSGLATSAEVGAITMLDEVVVGTYTMRQILTILASAMAGKVSGGGTSTITFRGINDASDVIVATVDASGNRSALTITV